MHLVVVNGFASVAVLLIVDGEHHLVSIGEHMQGAGVREYPAVLPEPDVFTAELHCSGLPGGGREGVLPHSEQKEERNYNQVRSRFGFG